MLGGDAVGLADHLVLVVTDDHLAVMLPRLCSDRRGWQDFQQTRISVLKGADCVIFVADSQASKLQENIESWNELQEQLRRMNKDVADFPLVMQWNKRDLQEVLPVTVLEQYLNPFRFPSFEAVAVTGQGVIECLRIGINSTLRRLERI